MKRWMVAVVCSLACLLTTVASTDARGDGEGKSFIICIDPGHQRKGDNSKEPIGPGAKQMKAKVSSGTRGVKTKKPEYELNLEISLKLKTELEQRGYEVVMTRESHDVNISNKERSEIANKAHADLFIRIHADGSDSPKAEGFSVLYPDRKNPYTKKIYDASKLASERIEREMKDSMKTKSRGVVPRADLTGFNWSQVPVTLVEVGFLTSPNEDKRLSQPAYQDKIVQGIANGVDSYASSAKEKSSAK